MQIAALQFSPAVNKSLGTIRANFSPCARSEAGCAEISTSPNDPMNQITNWTDDMKAELEGFIDQSSLEHVLELLSVICWEKADHIRLNWQHPDCAVLWERAGNRLAGLSAKADVTKLTAR